LCRLTRSEPTDLRVWYGSPVSIDSAKLVVDLKDHALRAILTMRLKAFVADDRKRLRHVIDVIP
jgi:hypothetical protein